MVFTERSDVTTMLGGNFGQIMSIFSEKRRYTVAGVLDDINSGLEDNHLKNASAEEIIKQVRIDNDEHIEEELTDEAIIQNVVNP